MSSNNRSPGLGVGSALIDSCIREPYSFKRLRADVLAGLTVGIGAIPLSMALAIAIGLPPQHGLYTALIAGFFAALLGGSRLSISGPTAAFVVILQPIVQSYGLSGLLLVTLMSGGVLVIMSLARLGRMIGYIPLSVTLGFTLGIAIILITQQIPDILGLHFSEPLPQFYLWRLWATVEALPGIHWPSVLVSLATMLVMIFWPKLRTIVPAHLPALLVGVAVAILLQRFDKPVDTIATRFIYLASASEFRSGVPPFLPNFEWPWKIAQPWSWTMARDLMPAALTVALLGAIQALLCAVMLDKMSAHRHHSNGELFAQGVSNMLVPFFGGFSSTAALARSTTSFRAGASSPVAALVHSLVVAACLLWFAGLLGAVPMASIAILLIMVARSLCGQHQLTRLLKKSPPGDIIVFTLCVSLTVLVDMIVAVMAGVVMSALLFMRDIARMTHVVDIGKNTKHVPQPLPESWGVYKISGPLFFAAANHVFAELREASHSKGGVLLYFDNVSVLDAGGLDELVEFMGWCRARGIMLIIADVPFQPLRAMVKAGIKPVANEFLLYATMSEAVQAVALMGEFVPHSGEPVSFLAPE